MRQKAAKQPQKVAKFLYPPTYPVSVLRDRHMEPPRIPSNSVIYMFSGGAALGKAPEGLS